MGAGIWNLGVMASLAAPLVGLADERGGPPLVILLVAAAGMALASWCVGVPRTRRWVSVTSFVVPLATAAEWSPRVILWIARMIVLAVVVAVVASFLSIAHGR